MLFVLLQFEFLEQEYFPGKLETNSLYEMIEDKNVLLLRIVGYLTTLSKICEHIICKQYFLNTDFILYNLTLFSPLYFLYYIKIIASYHFVFETILLLHQGENQINITTNVILVSKINKSV